MAITDELREYAHDCCARVDDAIHAIADRIDAECERQLEALYHDMSDDEYIELPKDADGEPIRIGDMMKGEKIGGGFGEPFEVVGYIMSNGELEPMDEHKLSRSHKYLHHHKQPTVEDVLTEFGIDWEHEDNCEDRAALLAEYAAKLREMLAESE